MIKKRMAHADSAEDKALFKSMMKKAVKKGKVASHLKKDIQEQKKAISEDKKLMKSMSKKGTY